MAQTLDGQYFIAHDCKKAGYHRLGSPTYLDQIKRLFVRHCKCCPYIYAGRINVNSNQEVSVTQMNKNGEFDSRQESKSDANSPPKSTESDGNV